MIKLPASVFMSAALIIIAAGVQARANDTVSDQQSIEKNQKAADSAQKDISDTMADIRTQRVKLNQDIAKFGADSDEVKQDRSKLKDLHQQVAEHKADMQKDQSKEKTQAAGQASGEAGGSSD